MFANGGTDYSKIKVGVKALEDAKINLGAYTKSTVPRNYTNKGLVIQAMANRDYETLREISNHFYRISGIYRRICDYVATMYRYDWYVFLETIGMDEKDLDESKAIKEFVKLLNFLDNSHIKKVCSDIALQVIKNGSFYGYCVCTPKRFYIQELPCKYCRTRYFIGESPTVEFNMRFFDDMFPDTTYRMKILKLFPKDFQLGYRLYKQNKLKPDYPGDNSGAWYLLDPDCAFKFCFHNDDFPLFVNTIPAILDLDAAQDLDRRKQLQQLLKIIVQKLPLDKNSDLVFDVEEARDIHNNAVEMLSRAIGVDVLTTFADIESIALNDKNTTATQDDLEKVERTVYNSFGISKNMFNTDGNLSLEKSILSDEAMIRDLLVQFEYFFDAITQKVKTTAKKYKFKFCMLETTQYNHKEMSKLYKEYVQLGFDKILPQIALGHSQSSILNNIFFENKILHLQELMIPPLMSSTMSSQDILGTRGQNTQKKTQSSTEAQGQQITTQQSAGRPEKPDDQKSAKTIANKESMS